MARVLIVDDSKIMRSLIRAALMKMGHEAIGEAGNGLEAYDMYFSLKPDIVTLDMSMPVMNGIETLKKIKEKDQDAKVIMLTANVQSSKLKEIIDAGADGYLFKPLNENELKALMDLLAEN
jgi:two-component system chemotaxis response regulator CheY